MDDDIRRRLALHEAGHCTVAAALGLEVEYATVEHVDGGGMRVVGQLVVPKGDLLRVVLGGVVGELAWGYRVPLVSDDLEKAYVLGDLDRRLAAWGDCWALLAERRYQHGLLAVALCRHGHLSQDEVGWWLTREPIAR